MQQCPNLGSSIIHLGFLRKTRMLINTDQGGGPASKRVPTKSRNMKHEHTTYPTFSNTDTGTI